MGQSLSRRPAPAPASPPAATSAPDPAPPNAIPTRRRSLPRRILSSFPKPSLGSRLLASSLTLPARSTQTLRGKNRRWGFSRRRNISSDTEGAALQRMDPLPEHDEHHADRDVDEFGVITHRVPDSHIDSPASSAKGKEKAKDPTDLEDDVEQSGQAPVPSSSTSTAPSLTQSGLGMDRTDCDQQIVVAPSVLPSLPQPSPLPQPHEPERPFVPLPPAPTHPSPPQPSSQQTNTPPRPFPPPGTLVVVQGVVHTTDVPRIADRPVATSIQTPSTIHDALNLNNTISLETNSTRHSSVPPGTRSRNPLSGILPRPTSMLPTVPSPPPSESTIDMLNIDSQHRQAMSNASGTTEDGEDEDRTNTHPHGISMVQGPVGASGLSASSVDVLGTLLSVAAAATAASLLTGSSEPIFSSGLTSSQSPPSSNSIPHVPSERPLSPTPTSDAGRMRHVWSSLRDRLGLGSGAHSSNHPNDTTPGSGLGQSIPSQPSDVVRPRDPREIMLAEMARAFNLGLGLGGTTGAPSAVAAANSNLPEPPIPDDGDALSRGGDGQHLLLPPPDSFERFLIDLQTDLRVTLMQEQGPGIPEVAPRAADEADDAEEDGPIPELQSLSDSDSEEFEMTHFDSDDEAESGSEGDATDEGDAEDVRTAQEQLSGRTSPAVSALGSGVHSPFGVRTRPGSRSSLAAGGMSSSLIAPSQPLPTATFSGTDDEVAANNSTADKDKSEDADAVHSTSSAARGMGTHVATVDSRQSGVRSEEGPESHREGAVLGVVHSLGASNGGRRVEAEGNVSGTASVPPLVIQDPSNALEVGTGQESLILGTSSLFGPLASAPSLPGGSALATRVSSQPSASGSLLGPEPTTQSSSSTNPNPPDSTMPFRLPFTPSSASRTEHTPGGGINWWRMYRFPAIASPNPGQHGPQGLSPLSQAAFSIPAQDPSHVSTSPWARPTERNWQNEMITPRGVAQPPAVHSGLGMPVPVPSAATSTNIPELVSTPNQSSDIPPSMSTNDQESHPPINTSINPPEHRGNVVVPVIVVGLQSVNMDRQLPHVPHPHVNHPSAMDDEDGEAVDFDGLEQPMSMPLHIPEPPEFRHHSSPSNMTQQEQGGQQPARGRTWQSRAANAIRNLRPSRRNADTASPQPQETPGSRTFLIYVIGGYYPPDHQIITGGNLDSFEALWELAELLGQVKPPTVSKEEIEKSGLEIIKASMLEDYDRRGRVASNCTERCLICLDDYNPEDELRVLTCKHTFHQGCVDRWLETGRNNCPACRTKGVGNESAEHATAAPSDPATA